MARKIGILPFGGEHWIAGVTYLQNIIRALNMLPGQERPDVYFLCHDQQDVDGIRRTYELQPSQVLVYTHRDTAGRRDKLKSWGRGVLSGRPAKSLEAVIRKSGIEVIAPAMALLGQEFPVPRMGWIPDLQHRYLHDFFSAEERASRDQLCRNQLQQTDLVIVSSQHAYDGLKSWLPFDPHQVGIFRFPAIPDESWYTGDLAAVLAKYSLPGKYLMLPCQFWKHKNHETLFEAIRILVHDKQLRDVVLVCSGSQKDFRHPDHFENLMAFVRRERLEEHIRCVGFIPREDQVLLIRGAAAIVQPSLFEGWCLMVEEVQTLGKQIYLSDIEVHREQSPRRATFFDPMNARELADAVEHDWASLPAGIDHAEEERARDLAHEKTIAFAKCFLSLVEQSIANYHAR